MAGYGRHQVWVLRHSGVTWEEIEAQLGISSENARDLFLQWSADLDARFREQWSGSSVRATIGMDELRILTDTSPAAGGEWDDRGSEQLA